MVTRSEPDYVWDFCGGHVALDFTNTVGNRGDAPEEHFNAYADVVSWAETRGVIGRTGGKRLRRERPPPAPAPAEALAYVRWLRESLYRALAAAASGRTPAAA